MRVVRQYPVFPAARLPDRIFYCNLGTKQQNFIEFDKKLTNSGVILVEKYVLILPCIYFIIIA